MAVRRNNHLRTVKIARKERRPTAVVEHDQCIDLTVRAGAPPNVGSQLGWQLVVT